MAPLTTPLLLPALAPLAAGTRTDSGDTAWLLAASALVLLLSLIHI